MNSKILYLGKFDSDIKNEFFDRAIAMIEEGRGDRFLYILPNGNLLSSLRKKMIDRLGTSNFLNIYTFDDISYRLAKKVDLQEIDENLKYIILREAVDRLRLEGKLSYYKNICEKDGFIKNISEVISSMKASIVRTEDFYIGEEDSSYYKEIGLIYREYSSLMASYNLMDKEDSFLHTIDGFKENYKGFLNNIDCIFIDEFYDFRPQELKIIEELAKENLDIYINMPFLRDENTVSLEESINYFSSMGFEIVRDDKLTYQGFHLLADSIFSREEVVDLKGQISLVEAATKELEVKKICELIKKEYRFGVDLKDMCLAVTSKDYYSLVTKIFSEEKIGHSLEVDISLVDIPLIKEVVYLLDYFIFEDKESFINRLKSSYFQLGDLEDIQDVEKKVKISCRDMAEVEARKEELGLETCFLKLDMERESLKKDNFKDYTQSILEILAGYNLEARIYSLYRENGNYDIFYRDLKAYKSLVGLLEDIVDIDDGIFSTMELRAYRDLLYRILRDEKIVIREGNNRGVKILSPTTVRGHSYKVVFVLGLSEGNYPNLSSKNFFLKDENMDFFRKIGYQYKNYYQKLDKEQTNFYIMLGQVEERLYLSYSRDLEDNEENIKSMFLDELLYSLKGETLEDKLEFIEIDMGDRIKKSLNDVTSLEDFGLYLLNREERPSAELAKLNFLNPGVLEDVYIRSLGEKSRQEGLDEYSGVLSKQSIIDDLKNQTEDRIYSISYLESYASCPYSFMLKNIFSLKEDRFEFEEFTNLDRGSINHLVLQDFYSENIGAVESHIRGKDKVDDSSIKDYLLTRYQARMKALGLDIGDIKYRLKAEVNCQKLFEFIEFDLHRLSNYKDKMLPVDLECSFGEKESFTLDTGERKLQFRGRIDRIDKFIDRDSYLIIDYKNSNFGLSTIEEIVAGVSLQLSVYILSQETRDIVGGVYGILTSKKMEIAMVDKDEKSIVGRSRKGVYPREDIRKIVEGSKVYIDQYVRGIEKGDFRVEPKACSEYCPYKNICRLTIDGEVADE